MVKETSSIPYSLKSNNIQIQNIKGYVYWITVFWDTFQQLLHEHNTPLDIPLKAKWHGCVDCLHFLCIVIHKHYIKENALDEETVSIWALWFSHSEHKCAVHLFASQINTTCKDSMRMIGKSLCKRRIVCIWIVQ